MKALKRLLIPTLNELIIYSILGVVILVVANLRVLLNLQLSTGTSDSIGSIFHFYSTNIFVHIDQVEAIGRLTNVLIWAGVGALAYMIVWGLLGAFTGVENEFIEETSYTEIDGKHQQRFWQSFVSRGLFRAAALLLLLLLTSFAIQVLVPASALLVKIWLNHPASLRNCLYALVGFLDIVVLMYLYAVLLRLIFMRTRVFA